MPRIICISLFLSFFCVGCEFAPVLMGRYMDDRMEQAKVDSIQSDTIYEVAGIKARDGDIDAIKVATRAETIASDHRERADRISNERSDLKSGPGPMDFIMGAIGGDWVGLVSMVLGSLGVGGMAYGSKMRGKASQMASFASSVAKMPPQEAEIALEAHPDVAKYRKSSKS